MFTHLFVLKDVPIKSRLHIFSKLILSCNIFIFIFFYEAYIFRQALLHSPPLLPLPQPIPLPPPPLDSYPSRLPPLLPLPPNPTSPTCRAWSFHLAVNFAKVLHNFPFGKCNGPFAGCSSTNWAAACTSMQTILLSDVFKQEGKGGGRGVALLETHFQVLVYVFFFFFYVLN